MTSDHRYWNVAQVRARVLIVDDHAGFRAVARVLLSNAGFDIVGESATGHDALDQVATLLPDVVLLDIALPDATGLEICQTIRAMIPAVTVVLCSVNPLGEYKTSVVADRGAAGFIPKDEFSAAKFRAFLG